MMTKKPITAAEFKKIYSKVPKLAVEVIIRTDEGILLTLRSLESYFGLWHIPGGTLRMRERVEDAAKRIAKEELGVEVEVQKLIGYIEHFSELEERGFGYSVGLEMLCRITSGQIKLDNQASEYGFFKVIPENTVKEHWEFLEKILKIN